MKMIRLAIASAAVVAALSGCSSDTGGGTAPTGSAASATTTGAAAPATGGSVADNPGEALVRASSHTWSAELQGQSTTVTNQMVRLDGQWKLLDTD